MSYILRVLNALKSKRNNHRNLYFNLQRLQAFRNPPFVLRPQDRLSMKNEPQVCFVSSLDAKRVAQETRNLIPKNFKIR